MKSNEKDHNLHFIEDEEIQDEGESWALSFADLMSLMAIFFMMLFTTDNLKYVIQTESKTAQNKALMEKEGSKIDMALRNFIEKVDLSPTKGQMLKNLIALLEDLPDRMSMENAKMILSDPKMQEKLLSNISETTSEREKLFTQIYQEIKKVKDLDGILEIIQERKNLRLVLKTSHLFEEGSAKIKAKLKKAIKELAQSIAVEKDRIYIHVEGHTDSRPIAKSYQKNFASNWELSTARATTVVRAFEKNGLLRNGLVAIGHGDTQPIAPNKDPQGKYIESNMQLNRRVTIKIFHKDGVDQ